MRFTGSIKDLLNNTFNFNGRSSKNDFWGKFGFVILLGLFIELLDVIIFNKRLFELVDAVTLSDVYKVLILFPTLSLTVRRLHDVNKSGWYYLLIFTIIGIIVVSFEFIVI